MSLYQKQMAQILKDAGIGFVEEYKFCDNRRFRFDFALKPLKCKLAIEINGGKWIKGKHTFGEQYQKDLEKLNLAQLMGWIILQYTPDNLPQVVTDLDNYGKKKFSN